MKIISLMFEVVLAIGILGLSVHCGHVAYRDSSFIAGVVCLLLFIGGMDLSRQAIERMRRYPN